MTENELFLAAETCDDYVLGKKEANPARCLGVFDFVDNWGPTL